MTGVQTCALPISGLNRLWVRFFLLAVFATMYVRDHGRPEFHKALGVDPTDYDFTVFRITSEISRQVFPLTLDIDNPKFRAGLDRLCEFGEGMAAARARGGIANQAKRLLLAGAAAIAFAQLYLLPARGNALPEHVRLQPAW